MLLSASASSLRWTELRLRRIASIPLRRQAHRSRRRRLTSWRLLPHGASLERTLGPLHARDDLQPLNRLPELFLSASIEFRGLPINVHHFEKRNHKFTHLSVNGGPTSMDSMVGRDALLCVTLVG